MWRHGYKLNLALLGATFLSLAFSGGLCWRPGAPGIDPAGLAGSMLEPRLLIEILRSGIPYALWVVAILGAHEMGHYLACRWYDIPATLPFFLPGIPPPGSFGAVIRIRGRIPDRRSLFDVAAAGPLAGFAVSIVALVCGTLQSRAPVAESGRDLPWVLGEPLLMIVVRELLHGAPAAVNAALGASWIGLLVTSLNLFPVGQLDGGHAAYALSRRLHRVLAYLTLVALFLLIVSSILRAQVPAYLAWFAVLLWMRDRHPRLVDETAGLGPGRKLVALVLGIIFALCFLPVPLRVV